MSSTPASTPNVLEKSPQFIISYPCRFLHPQANFYDLPFPEPPYNIDASASELTQSQVHGHNGNHSAYFNGLPHIENCVLNHRSCARSSLSKLPTRVLDVKDRVFLHQSHGKRATYIALSHCWGQRPHIRAIISNLAAREREIPWSFLPILFQGAVTITRQLGIHYLWIDALCIVQDDGIDWQMESAKMTAV